MYDLTQNTLAGQQALFPDASIPAAEPRHLLASKDLEPGEIRLILDLAKILKRQRNRLAQPIQPVENRILAMIFEKQSLRTRFTFETAIMELGGHAIYLTKADIDMGERESVYDVANNISRWSTMIVARLKSHQSLVELAKHSSVPVINALTDLEHPCQALADLMTVEEHLGAGPLNLAWIGDGNNVANSFAVTAAKLGHEVVICTPPGYEAVDECYALGSVTHCYDPAEAVSGAHAVYTDVWISMGQEDEKQERLKRFAKYQVNADLMAKADENAVFLHCLPARRDQEVTGEVIDGNQSVVFDQAENRLHTQKALMKLILDGVLN
ncbi:MAG: ornithine carbamoyltransferase [Armatimonadetes bacterium]|nr:ornithine carbamoyltransferase [Armatimonadota bacterium]